MPKKRREQKEVKERSVERRIHFYRIDAGLEESGRPIPFDPVPILAHLNSLPFSDDGRYLADSDGNAHCVWIHSLEAPLKISFGVVRRNGLPLLENSGDISPLDLDARQGLLERTHIIFFPDNIVGADFNFYGPKVGYLKHYFRMKAGGLCGDIGVQNLVRDNIVDELRKFNRIRTLSLKLHASFIDTVRQADESLGDGLRATRDAGGADTIEVVLQMSRKNPGGLAAHLMQGIRSLVGRVKLHEELETLKIKGKNEETGKVETLDLLQDQLIVSRRILTVDKRSRALKPESAFSEIESAYNDLAEELKGAAGIL